MTIQPTLILGNEGLTAAKIARESFGFGAGIMSSEDLHKMGRHIRQYDDATRYDSEEAYRQAKEREKEYKHDSETRRLTKFQDRRAYAASHPIRNRVRSVGTRGLSEVKESYGQTNKTMTKKAPGVLRRIAGSFTGVSSNRPVIRTGLSSIADEISEGWIDPFSRSYFNEPNSSDKDFFGNIDQPKEKDFFGHDGHTGIDMNNLTTDPIKKTQEVKYV